MRSAAQVVAGLSDLCGDDDDERDGDGQLTSHEADEQHVGRLY